MSAPIDLDLYHDLVVVWLALSALVWLVLLFVPAPYGRHARLGLGPALSPRAGWMWMEGPAVVGMAFFVLTGAHDPVAFILLVMWEIHYLHRAIVYPLRLRGRDKSMPLVIVASGFFFNLVNGYLNGRGITAFAPAYGVRWLSDPRFLVGVALFFTGFFINLRSDAILLNLRKPGETGYQIPYGGLYRFISSPNYFGEIVEWTGWALACWSLGPASFAVWTFANLMPRAVAHHRWYRRTFPEYPQERRAIIPFVI
jgi:protein-S-isoprenylcysteine O-methyltransferase Ste14